MRAAEHTVMIRSQTKERYESGLRELESFLAIANEATARAALKHAIDTLHKQERRTALFRPSSRRDELASQLRRNNESRKSAGNARQRWTAAHDELVLSAHMTDKEIGLEIGRSILAVRVRRVVLSKRALRDEAGNG